MKKILCSLLGVLLVQNALACTAVDIQAKDGSMVAGRTMEWAYEMDWKILFYPKGSPYQLTSPAESKTKPVDMISKYAIIGIGTGLENDAMLEGQNSVGLGISGNFLPGFTEYQNVTHKDKHALSVLEFTRFVLSNYATVEEVKKDLPKYKVWAPDLQNLPVKPTIHFLISDKTGANIVIEFINGEMKIFDKSIGVMTNSPTYDWHLTNVRNYVNLSNTGATSRQSSLGDVTSFGQGVGGIGLPGDYTPPSRFIKTTFLAYYSDKANNSAEAISEVDHILNAVDIPKGATAAVDKGTRYSDYTQWLAIKDLTNNQLYFGDYDHRTNFIKIDFDSLVKNSTKPISIETSKLNYPTNDITSSLIK